MTADNVNPAHYRKGAVETIVIIDEIASHYGSAESFAVGTILKYLSRAPFKGNKLEDLKKAAWYLSHLIEIIEKAQKTK